MSFLSNLIEKGKPEQPRAVSGTKSFLDSIFEHDFANPVMETKTTEPGMSLEDSVEQSSVHDEQDDAPKEEVSDIATVNPCNGIECEALDNESSESLEEPEKTVKTAESEIEDHSPAPASELIPFEAIQHGDYKLLAIEKIRKECENFDGKPMSACLKESLSKQLVSFIDQNELLAEVVYRTKRSLGDCCDAIMDAVSQARTDNKNQSCVAMSDVVVYTEMLRFYFPDSEVSASITIKLGQKPSDEEIDRVIEKPQAKAEKKATEKPTKGKRKAKAKNEGQETLDALFNMGNEVTAEPEQEEPSQPKEEQKPVYKCSSCGCVLSDSAVATSLSSFGKYLCKACRKKAADEEKSCFVQLSLL